jgi:hypothetical protein
MPDNSVNIAGSTVHWRFEPMGDIDAGTVKSTAQIYRQRYGKEACNQATLRAMELESLRSDASRFWRAVVAELEKNSTGNAKIFNA